MEIEQKVRIEKQEISLIHTMYAIYSPKRSHKWGSEFPSKQVKKRNRINHEFQSQETKTNQLHKRNSLSFWYREL